MVRRRSGRVLAAFLRSRSGSSAIEFGVIIVPMLLMIMAVIDFGRLQWTRNALQEVAVATARCVGMKARNCGVATTAGGKTTYSYNAATAVQQARTESAAWSVALPTSEVAIVASTSCQGVAGFAQVTLTHNFYSGFLTAAGLNSYPITAVACFPNQT